jgi:hypothetical protein
MRNLVSYIRDKHRLRIFRNRVLRSMVYPKTDEGTGQWRRLHNEELNVLYPSPNIIWVTKTRRMRWVGHVAHMGDRRGTWAGFWWGDLRERDNLEDLHID